MTPLLEVAADVGEVVDLAVEDHLVAPIVRLHGLVTLDREVEDGEAPMTQRHTCLRIEPGPGVVGTPMRQRIGHGTQKGLGVPAESSACPETGNTAHGCLPNRKEGTVQPPSARRASSP